MFYEMRNIEAKREVRDIERVYINGEKRTIGKLWVYMEAEKTWYYDGGITAKGWYKTTKGILNNRLNDGLFM